MADAPGDELVTIDQATTRYQVSAKTLRRRLSRSEIPGAFKRPGPTGTEWALPVASLAALGYQATAVVVVAEPVTPAEVVAQRDAWQRRALDAEALAEEQADLLDQLAEAGPSAAARGAPATPRSTKVDERSGPSRGGLTVLLAVLLAFLAFVGGIVFAGLGDDPGGQGLRAPPGSATSTSGPAASTTPAAVTTPGPSTTGAPTAPPVTTVTTAAPRPTTTAAPQPTTTAPPQVTTPPASTSTTAPAPAPGPTVEPRTTAPAGTAVVVHGGSFWSVAEDHLAAALGHPPTDAETGHYWVQLMHANADHLPQPGNFDLLYAGTTLTLPPL